MQQYSLFAMLYLSWDHVYEFNVYQFKENRITVKKMWLNDERTNTCHKTLWKCCCQVMIGPAYDEA